MGQISEPPQRVYNGVSSDYNFSSRNALGQQSIAGMSGRGEVNLRDDGNESAVRFLWERVIDVVTPKSRLNMPNRNLAVVGGESRAECRSGIALDQDNVGLEAMACVFHRIDHAARKHAQCLICSHDV